MRKLSEHPIPIVISVIAGLVGIIYTVFVFITGKPGLTFAEHNRTDELKPKEQTNKDKRTTDSTSSSIYDTLIQSKLSSDEHLTKEAIERVTKNMKGEAKNTVSVAKPIVHVSDSLNNVSGVKDGEIFDSLFYESEGNCATITGGKIFFHDNIGTLRLVEENKLFKLVADIKNSSNCKVLIIGKVNGKGFSEYRFQNSVNSIIEYLSDLGIRKSRIVIRKN